MELWNYENIMYLQILKIKMKSKILKEFQFKKYFNFKKKQRNIQILRIKKYF